MFQDGFLITKTQDLAVKTIVFTALALVAFASNSVLCRWALAEGSIDAASFTGLRLLSGALVLLVIIRFCHPGAQWQAKGSWLSGFLLFLYAIAFSFAYNTLSTGTGALILFASVQITMIRVSMAYGNRLRFSEWLGVSIAFAGFLYLVLPGVSRPSWSGLLLMALAGAAWGLYSLRGRASENPLLDTAHNFTRTVPLVVLVMLLAVGSAHYSVEGVVLAVVSGGIASGIGYAVWYAALKGLSASQAAVVQLLVPIIAAAGGVIFVSEPVTQRLMLAAMLILGGILLVVLGHHGIRRNPGGNESAEP